MFFTRVGSANGRGLSKSSDLHSIYHGGKFHHPVPINNPGIFFQWHFSISLPVNEHVDLSRGD